LEVRFRTLEGALDRVVLGDVLHSTENGNRRS
jgi:hypothetical protein